MAGAVCANIFIANMVQPALRIRNPDIAVSWTSIAYNTMIRRTVMLGQFTPSCAIIRTYLTDPVFKGFIEMLL